ncbi:MAG: hydroxyacid dehydrogenase [Hyphomicrobiales bacterium]|nr:MAG: hydroxyacid dehydrogenase [Hyphomicrobiales bacterium]
MSSALGPGPHTCLVVQPMHAAGLDLLAAAGVELICLEAATMGSVAAVIGGCSAVITRNLGLSAAAIEAGHRLQVIGNHGAGVDRVDVSHATSLGIPVVYTPGTNAQAVAEHTILLALAVARRLVRGHQAVTSGRWDVRYEPGAMELRGKTLGIVGFGAIGRTVAQIASAGFGMRVHVLSPLLDPQEMARLGYTEAASLEQLLSQSDVVTLHRPSDPGTPPLINRLTLAHARRGSILINTARAALVDDQALLAALESGQLAGAGLDVFTHEPLDPAHPLLVRRDVVLSPHVGASTQDALERMSLSCAQQILDVLSGRRPPHLANPQAWDRRRMPAPVC